LGRGDGGGERCNFAPGEVARSSDLAGRENRDSITAPLKGPNDAIACIKKGAPRRRKTAAATAEGPPAERRSVANKAAGPGEMLGAGYKGAEVRSILRAGSAAKSALGNGHEPFSPYEGEGEKEREGREEGEEAERAREEEKGGEKDRESNVRGTDKIKTRWPPPRVGGRGGGEERE